MNTNCLVKKHYGFLRGGFVTVKWIKQIPDLNCSMFETHYNNNHPSNLISQP